MNAPKKWHEVYPYGTKSGNEEASVFRALSRHSKFDWRSTGAIVKDTGLTRERVEEIIEKYVNKIQPPLIYAHPTNEDHWCYWERCPEVLKKDDRSISKKDKDNRIDKQIAGADIILNDSMSYPITLHNRISISDLKESPIDIRIARSRIKQYEYGQLINQSMCLDALKIK